MTAGGGGGGGPREPREPPQPTGLNSFVEHCEENTPMHDKLHVEYATCNVHVYYPHNKGIPLDSSS